MTVSTVPVVRPASLSVLLSISLFSTLEQLSLNGRDTELAFHYLLPALRSSPFVCHISSLAAAGPVQREWQTGLCLEIQPIYANRDFGAKDVQLTGLEGSWRLLSASALQPSLPNICWILTIAYTTPSLYSTTDSDPSRKACILRLPRPEWRSDSLTSRACSMLQTPRQTSKLLVVVALMSDTALLTSPMCSSPDLRKSTTWSENEETSVDAGASFKPHSADEWRYVQRSESPFLSIHPRHFADLRHIAQL